MNSSFDEGSIAMHFETDLINPRELTSWGSSFEFWWIRKVLLEGFGENCMNCTMKKKEGINVEVVQIAIKRATYKDLLDIENYQILCRRCNDHRHMLEKADCRPEGWQSIVSSINDKNIVLWGNVKNIKIGLEKLRYELKAQGIQPSISDKEVMKEIGLAKLIATYHHRFISKAARNDDFVSRDNKYTAYLKLLKMNFQSLQKWEVFSKEIFNKVYSLSKNSIRQHLVECYGGLSKTSMIYAMMKEEYSRSSFLKSW